VATRVRAENALEQLQKYGGRNLTGPDGAPARARTIAFCVSQRHADFMAEY